MLTGSLSLSLSLPSSHSSRAIQERAAAFRAMAAACGFCLLAVLLLAALSPRALASAATAVPAKLKAAPAPVVAGPVSRVEDASMFQIYYGQSFKVIKNYGDGKSYLLMQAKNVQDGIQDQVLHGIKSFVIPLANFSVDTTTSPDEDKGCNFAAYVPLEEDTPLQRAEWIKYLGTFTNSEDRANAVYDAIKRNYLCLSKAAANLSTRFKPIVAWIEYTQGMWAFIKENYTLQFVIDAGAEIVDATITNKRFNSSDPEDMDNFHAILCTVDVVIDQTYALEPAEYKLSTFLDNINVSHDSCFSFVSNRSIWRFDKRIGASGTLDWYDGAISQPQLVIRDLIEVFFPTGNYTTIYFRNLAKEEEVTEIGPEMCTRSISTPMEPIVLPCQL
ncbi:LOW QUALITY PROTEIN: hypothetical protein U9M48_005902 [Paspalum notatum var. saurae]|uniref:Fe/B12 periplasmic-binding domain-containing protein n=1 Tax=Paspalum notatum var. saurae TaxID=547442 RepID=A0AAQ3PR48_PASNO